jgi:hypothetical protein
MGLSLYSAILQAKEPIKQKDQSKSLSSSLTISPQKHIQVPGTSMHNSVLRLTFLKLICEGPPGPITIHHTSNKETRKILQNKLSKIASFFQGCLITAPCPLPHPSSK